MNKVIIYPTDEGTVSIVFPTPEFLETKTIEELVEKVVPAGKPYKIIGVSEIPTDPTFRNAWEYKQ
jgi:hypothetical protein